MWSCAGTVVITSGIGKGITDLRAFDDALIQAKIGDYNLLKVSSIIPAGALILNIHEGEDRINILPKGSFLPSVISSIASANQGETIATCIVLGIPLESSRSGVIFECSVIGTKELAEREATRMVQEAMEERGVSNYELFSASEEVSVKEKSVCTICAAVLLP